MTDLVFVDTNVLVYARDSRDAAKQQRAYEWLAYLWDQRSGRVSTQVLQEFYITVTQKLKPGLSPAEARSDVRALLAWLTPVSTPDLVEGAWRAQDRYGLSWWDALLVAAAKTGECRYLLTEDLQDGQNLDGLEVRSPFRAHDQRAVER